MIGGTDRYFQIARCFRDEDLRLDRQPEFTQIDVEMSFVDQEDIMQLIEHMVKLVFKETKNIDLPSPMPRLSFEEAMGRYGTDKPDLRFDLQLQDLSQFAKSCDFKVFRSAVESGGMVKALVIPGGNSFTRNRIDNLIDTAKEFGAKGLAWVKINEEGDLDSSIAKFFNAQALREALPKAQPGDLIIFVADSSTDRPSGLRAYSTPHGRRTSISGPKPVGAPVGLNFPMFEYDDAAKRYVALHHPFTAPQSARHTNTGNRSSRSQNTSL